MLQLFTANFWDGVFWGVAVLSALFLAGRFLLVQTFRTIALFSVVAGVLFIGCVPDSARKIAPSLPPIPKRPWFPNAPWNKPKADLVGFGAFKGGGKESPFGGATCIVNLPAEYRMKNVGGRDGAGLCVFTSAMHAARYQDEKRLWNFQQKMRAELGGGYPEKLDRMIAKYGPGTDYVQHTGGDPEFLELALKTRRMPCVTYSGRDGRYRGRISHMVNLVYLDATQAAILDNNYINDYLWMSRDEFLSRWREGGGGWGVALLSSPPPPEAK